MAKSKFLQSSFVSGELSPLLKGRVDLDQYYQGMETAENVLIVPQGGLKRRAGTQHVDTAENILAPFIFSGLGQLFLLMLLLACLLLALHIQIILLLLRCFLLLDQVFRILSTQKGRLELIILLPVVLLLKQLVHLILYILHLRHLLQVCLEAVLLLISMTLIGQR